MSRPESFSADPVPPDKVARRRPGRPQAKELSGDQLRQLIITASAEVYAARGYHGVSVERILKAAGVSRPTFYRYFKGRYEVLDVVIAAVNDQLRNLVTQAMARADNLEQLLESVVVAYFEWAELIGPLVGPVYREIHDRASPASHHRLRLLDELMAVFTEQPGGDFGITTEPLIYDAAIHVVEHLGHSTFWPELLPAREREHRKKIIVQAVRGMLIIPEAD